MIPGEIFTSFAEFHGIVSVNDFSSGNFCKLLWVYCGVFVLHGYVWIHWVVDSCTTTAYRWLCRDSQLSLRTLWFAALKSPKFSARSTAPPLRQNTTGLPVLYRGFRFTWCWILLASVSSGRLDLPSTEFDTYTGEKSRSRVWISLIVGEEDKVEEDDQEWLSCLKGVFEVDENPEDELDKPGTTIKTKFSVLQGIQIPFLMGCGFWPLIHS